jgi:hypothetical protein
LLILFFNQLRSLPPQIDELKTLESLDLSWNRLNSLPNQIGELKSLKWLSLPRNNLKRLPIEVFSNMPNLKKIVLADKVGANPFSETFVSNLRLAMPWCEIEFDPNVIFKYNQSTRAQQEIEASNGEARLKDEPNDTVFKKELADTYNSLAFYQLLTGQFPEAEASINRGFSLDSTNIYLPTNRALALLLQGKTAAAMHEYKKWKDLPYRKGKPFYRDAFLDDLNELESADVIPEARQADVEAVRRLLGVKKE